MNKPAKPGLRPLDDALAELISHARPLEGADVVDTFDADGRVLAQDLVSPVAVPPRDNSAMDGYAVRSADVAEPGVVLQVTQRIPAGTVGQPLQPLSAARIFTGAWVPSGADAVVMQEETELVNECEGGVRFKVAAQPGAAVRRAGEDIALGQVVLARGARLTPAALGLAASVGAARLQVALRPRVALFSTGDELVMPGEVAPADLPAGAIYNSNRFFLRALLHRMGCEVTDMGIVPDRLDATVQALGDAAARHHLVLTSGGVSVGEEDHVRPAVQQLGELHLWSLAIKPGKPFAYGRLGRDAQAAHFIGLPGNPAASYVTFLLLVRPFLLRLQGAGAVTPRPVPARAGFAWPGDRRREFMRVCRQDDGTLALFPNQGSGVLTSTVWGDGLVDNPPGQAITPGDMVSYLPMAELL